MKKLVFLVQLVGTVTVLSLAFYGLLAAMRAEVGAQGAAAEGQVLAATGGAATVPETVNYQGILRDDAGKTITGTHDIVARIWDNEIDGTEKYSTTATNVTVLDGVFNVVLGDPEPLPAGLFEDAERFIGISVDGAPELSPRQRLHSVPWAMSAVNAAEAQGLDDDATLSNLTDTGTLNLGQGHLRYGSLDDFRLIYRQDFESGNNDGWQFIYEPNYNGRTPWNDTTNAFSPNTYTSGSNSYLLGCGGYPISGYFPSYGEVFKLLDLPVGIEEVVVRLTYYSFDSWDAKTGWVLLDGLDDTGTRITPTYWLEIMAWSDWGRRHHGCDPFYTDAARQVELRAPMNTSSTHRGIRISANSNLPGPPNWGAWESFAIDDVEVWVR